MSNISESVNCNELLINRTAVLATMHQKERVIAPILERELGVTILVPADFDTDIFGTFTREVKRLGTQIEAARLKAEKALEIAGETLAFASEGTFGPHPMMPYLAANREIVILLDRDNNLELIGESLSVETNYSHQLVSSIEEADNFAKQAGFPEHGMVVIVGEAAAGKGEIVKGIVTEEQLFDAVTAGLKKSSTGRVHIETDMRAMYNPTRMKNIENATLDLVKKFQQFCPECGWPGFEVAQRKIGLPCGLCYFPSQLVRSTIYKCKNCGYTKEELFPDGRETADPAQCQYCNP
jgi:ribosomal protein S27AE